MDKIVIFLDFDGVLHPQLSPTTLLFERTPLLAEALSRYNDHYELVISLAEL